MEGYYLLFDVLPWTCQKFPRKLYCSEVHGSKVHRNVHRRFHRSFRGNGSHPKLPRKLPWKYLPRKLPCKFPTILPWKLPLETSVDVCTAMEASALPWKLPRVCGKFHRFHRLPKKATVHQTPPASSWYHTYSSIKVRLASHRRRQQCA